MTDRTSDTGPAALREAVKAATRSMEEWLASSNRGDPEDRAAIRAWSGALRGALVTESAHRVWSAPVSDLPSVIAAELGLAEVALPAPDLAPVREAALREALLGLTEVAAFYATYVQPLGESAGGPSLSEAVVVARAALAARPAREKDGAAEDAMAADRAAAKAARPGPSSVEGGSDAD